jgi:hypothetical protein
MASDNYQRLKIKFILSNGREGFVPLQQIMRRYGIDPEPFRKA